MPRPVHLLAALLVSCLCLHPALCRAAQDLLDLYGQALRNDPGFKAEQAAFDASREAKPQAVAAMLPQLDARVSSGLNLYVDKDAPTPSEDDSYRSRQHYDTKSYSVNLRQSLIDLSQWARLFQAEAEVEQARSTLAAARQALMIKVAERYFEVLKDEDQLRYLGSEIKAVAVGVEAAKRASELGVASPTDYLKGQASLDMVQAREVTARGKLFNSREGLRELIGGEPGELASLTRKLPAMRPQPQIESHWTELAEKRNPALASHLHAMEAAGQELYGQMAGHLPVLSLDGSHGYTDEPGGKVPGEDVSSSIALVLRVPLFSGGLVRSQVRQARARLRQARNRYEAQKRLLVRKVREAYHEVLTTARWMEALQKANRSSVIAVQRSQRSYQVGTIDMVSLLASIRELSLNQRDLSQARHRHVLSWLHLYQAVGTLSEKQLQLVNGLLLPGGELGPSQLSLVK